MENTNGQKIYQPGEFIMVQGEFGDAAYIIEEGQVEILIQQPDGTEHSVGTRGPGSIVGEMAIIDNGQRVASIRAVTESHLIEISQDDFSRYMNGADPILKMIVQVLLTRYRDTLQRLGPPINTKLLNVPFSNAEELEKSAEGTDLAVKNIKMVHDLKAALNENQLFLVYQPIISLDQTKICGFEALMRWNHPERGLVSPGEFIPVMEDSRLIVDASKWALRQACTDLKILQAESGDDDLFMNVNFTSEDFNQHDFVDQVENTLNETGVSVNNVKLEITERLLMDDPEQARKALEACVEMGLGVALDDFGTGYSSLSYLHAFPIGTLKIDRSFVCRICDDRRSRELAKSIIALGKSLQMAVVAEGIEQEAEHILLRSFGCEYGQGFFYARPAPLNEVMNTVKDWTLPTA